MTTVAHPTQDCDWLQQRVRATFLLSLVDLFCLKKNYVNVNMWTHWIKHNFIDGTLLAWAWLFLNRAEEDLRLEINKMDSDLFLMRLSWGHGNLSGKSKSCKVLSFTPACSVSAHIITIIFCFVNVWSNETHPVTTQPDALCLQVATALSCPPSPHTHHNGKMFY
jgi:hypothetical protein